MDFTSFQHLLQQNIPNGQPNECHALGSLPYENTYQGVLNFGNHEFATPSVPPSSFPDPCDPFQSSYNMGIANGSNIPSGPFDFSSVDFNMRQESQSQSQNQNQNQNQNFFAQASFQFPNELQFYQPMNSQVVEPSNNNPLEDVSEAGEDCSPETKSTSKHTRKRKVTVEERGNKRIEVVKGQWNSEEDRKLTALVKEYGTKRWSAIASRLEGRVGKQCRERWQNHLSPNVKKEKWSEEEDKVLIEAHKRLGGKWSEITNLLPGRSENNIKNHWNATKRRQLVALRRGHSKSPTALQRYIGSVISTPAGGTSQEFEAGPSALDPFSNAADTAAIQPIPTAREPAGELEQMFNWNGGFEFGSGSSSHPVANAETDRQEDLDARMDDFLELLTQGFPM